MRVSAFPTDLPLFAELTPGRSACEWPHFPEAILSNIGSEKPTRTREISEPGGWPNDRDRFGIFGGGSHAIATIGMLYLKNQRQ